MLFSASSPLRQAGIQCRYTVPQPSDAGFRPTPAVTTEFDVLQRFVMFRALRHTMNLMIASHSAAWLPICVICTIIPSALNATLFSCGPSNRRVAIALRGKNKVPVRVCDMPPSMQMMDEKKAGPAILIAGSNLRTSSY